MDHRYVKRAFSKDLVGLVVIFSIGALCIKGMEEKRITDKDLLEKIGCVFKAAFNEAVNDMLDYRDSISNNFDGFTHNQ